MDTVLINSIDWGNLEHAYGNAVDVPKQLAILLGEDQDARDDAVNDFLYGSAYHQGSVFSCTPSVMKCVIHIIRHEDIFSLETMDGPLIRELLNFLSICAITWRFVPEIGKVAYEGRDLYSTFLDHTDNKTAGLAKELVDICNAIERS